MRFLFTTHFKCLLVVAMVFVAFGAVPKVHAAGYLYYAPITVSSSTAIASGTNTSFPMLVSSTLPQWIYPGGQIQNITTAPRGGQEPADLVFATSIANCGASNLNFETESYSPSTGSLVDWVNVPTMAAGTVIYACWGNSSVTIDQSNPAGTWNPNYSAVYHFAAPTGTLSSYDSTVNANTLDSNVGVVAAAGEADGGAGFNGNNSYLTDTANFNDTPSSTMTICSWINTTSSAGQFISSIARNPSDIYGEYLFSIINGYLNFGDWSSGSGFSGASSSNISADDGNWHLVCFVKNSLTGTYYTDGKAAGGETATKNVAYNPWNFAMGYNIRDFGGPFGGNMDESEMSTVALSPSWLLTEYNNQASPSVFYTLGSEESQTLPVTILNISGKGTTIAWTTNMGSDSLVNYGTSTTYTASSTYSSAYVTSHSVTLTGLLPNTTYHYQVVDSDGYSVATSSDMLFIAAAPAITNIISTPSGNGGVITWTTDAISDSLINYGTSTTYTASSTYSSAYVTSHSVTLTGLLPNTTYHYQVVSSDGSVATSSDQTFTTAPPIILGIVSSPGITTSTIGWTTNASSDSLINYGTSTTYTASSTYSSAYVTSHSVTLTGLLPNTTYHYQVVSSDGSVATSSDQTFTTAPLVISNVSWNGTALTWTTNVPADSLVHYGTSTAYTASSTYSSAYIMSHMVILTGLLPNTTYHYQVVSSDGSVATSSDQTFTTTILVFLGHVAAGSTTSSATTAGLDITNANFLAACYSANQYGVPTTPITDSLGNTWTRASVQNEDGDVISALWYVANPKRGSSDVFTVTGGTPELSVMAFAGVTGGVDQHSSSQGSGSPFSIGNLTPSVPNELIVACNTGVYEGTSTVTTVSPPFAMVDALPYVNGQFSVLDSAYEIQIATTTVDPVWSYDPSGPWTGTTANSFYSYLSPPALSIPTTTLPEGFNGKAYNYQLSPIAGTYPFIWTIASGTLPTGLSLSSGGLISGTSTQTILRDPLVFQVQDAHNEIVTSSLPITIASSSPLITTTLCPGGTQYTAYAGCTVIATGGTTPYTFSWSTSTSYASIPEGLSIGSSNGVIGGTVYGQGTYVTQFIATDAIGATTTQNISFAIAGDSTLGGCSLFPSDSIFHTNISDLPVDTSPAAAIPSVYQGASIKPFFGSASGGAPNGIPFIRVPWNQPMSTVATTIYQSYYTSGPFPTYVPIEGTSNNIDSDRHTLVLQTAGGGNPCRLWEMWQGMNTGTSSWTDSSNAYWPDLTSDALTPLDTVAATYYGTTDAAGLPIMPLLANYDEVASGVITHPIRFTLQHMERNYVWPATDGDAGIGSCENVPGGSELSQSSPPSSCSNSAPAGEIYRLKASVPTPSQCSGDPQALTIIQAFRNYGIILADNGISGGLIGTPDTRWSDSQLSCLTNLNLSEFEPVNLSGVMIDPDSAAASFASLSSPATSTSLTVPLAISTPISSTTTKYFVSELSTAPASTTAGWTSVPPPFHTFGTAANSHTLYSWVQDGAGNVFTGASTTINFPYYALPATNTVQAFTASGIVTSTGASVTATPAITFIYPVQISAGASTVSIPSGTTMTTPSNSDFTAIIATTSVITANLPSNSGVAGAMQYGFTSTTIVLSQPITITIPVSSSYDGQTLAVYNSEDGGVSWTQFTTCTVAGSACSFTTSNLSSFAVVVPLTPITPSNPSGPVVDVASGGGFYFPSAVATSTAIVSAPTSSLSTTGMTVAQMENLLASLQAELQALEAKSGSQASAVFTRDLVAGMTGNDVKQLQLFLIQADVGSAAQKLKANGVTHYFGSLTKAALIELQKHADIIPAVGYFGPITRKYVNSFFP